MRVLGLAVLLLLASGCLTSSPRHGYPLYPYPTIAPGYPYGYPVPMVKPVSGYPLGYVSPYLYPRSHKGGGKCK